MRGNLPNGLNLGWCIWYTVFIEEEKWPEVWVYMDLCAVANDLTSVSGTRSERECLEDWEHDLG